MSLSKNQKRKLYGNNIQAEPAPNTPASRYRQGELYAEPTKSSSHMYLVVAFIVSCALGAYNFFWVLPQFARLSGNPVPELLLAFGSNEVAAFANNISPDYLAQYISFHRSSALVFPVLFALTWAGFIFTAKLPVTLRNIFLAVPALFTVVFIAGGLVLDAALTNPESGPVGIASTLISLRWLLFVLMFAQLGYLGVRLVTGKVDAFSRGELPGQQR